MEPPPPSPGGDECITGWEGGLLVRRGGWLCGFGASGLELFRTPLAAPDAAPEMQRGETPPARSAPAMLENGTCVVTFGPHLVYIGSSGSIETGLTGEDQVLLGGASPNCTPDGKLVLTCESGEVNLVLHEEVLALTAPLPLPGRRRKGPRASCPAVYPDGSLACCDTFGLRRLMQDGMVRWTGPAVRLDRAPVLDLRGICAVCDLKGRTLFLDPDGLCAAEFPFPMLCAERPGGGWAALGDDRLLLLDARHRESWSRALPTGEHPPLVDRRGWICLLDGERRLLLFDAAGDLKAQHEGIEPAGAPSLVRSGRVAVPCRDELLLLG